MKPAKILYFIDGPSPSSEDFHAAQALKAQVVFRNAQMVPSEKHSLEDCDGVAGDVPPIYADAYPPAKEAIAKKDAELKDLSSKVGDVPAPKRGQKTESETAPVPTPNPDAPTIAAPKVDDKPKGKPAAWTPNPT